MTADRPVSPAPDTVTDDMVRVAAEAIEDAAIPRIGRDLGTLHRDEIVRAGLEAVVPLIRARVAAELIVQARKVQEAIDDPDTDTDTMSALIDEAEGMWVAVRTVDEATWRREYNAVKEADRG